MHCVAYEYLHNYATMYLRVYDIGTGISNTFQAVGKIVFRPYRLIVPIIFVTIGIICL